MATDREFDIRDHTAELWPVIPRIEVRDKGWTDDWSKGEHAVAAADVSPTLNDGGTDAGNVES
jgi:hypothetical protein